MIERTQCGLGATGQVTSEINLQTPLYLLCGLLYLHMNGKLYKACIYHRV